MQNVMKFFKSVKSINVKLLNQLTNYLIGKNKSAKKKVGKNCWVTKILVTCTKFSHFSSTKFT